MRRHDLCQGGSDGLSKGDRSRELDVDALNRRDSCRCLRWCCSGVVPAKLGSLPFSFTIGYRSFAGRGQEQKGPGDDGKSGR